MAVFTTNDSSVCLWNVHYNVSSSLNDSSFAQFNVLYFSIWIIIASIFVAYFRDFLISACLQMTIIINLVHWLILHIYLDLHVCFLFYLSQASMFILVHHKENHFLSIAYCFYKIFLSPYLSHLSHFNFFSDH